MLSLSCRGSPRLKHERMIQMSSKMPVTEPMTIPTMAPALRVEESLLGAGAGTVTVTVGGACLAKRADFEAMVFVVLVGCFRIGTGRE